MKKVIHLKQYPTPFWIAEALISHYFPGLGENDFVIEPSCGPGSFLAAIPDSVPAIGIDIDPKMVIEARHNTGKNVICGDFCTVPIDRIPTAIIGNPPFNMRLIDGFLDRAHQLLIDGGQVGFILPSYALQTANRVMRYNSRWSISQDMIPRQIFPRLSKSLIFAVFSKDDRRYMTGFYLYPEVSAIQKCKMKYRTLIDRGVTKSVWVKVVENALMELQGQATLDSIYLEIESNRPTNNTHWKAKIRQTLQLFFPRIDNEWQLPYER